MPNRSHDRMSPEERRAGASLAAIFALRMLGLFLILPVFSVFAAGLPGGEDRGLAGFAFGVFGLTQAIFQIPFGTLSDRFGRKPVIVYGLIMFAVGCFVAAWAPNIYWMIFGRVLQGAGAISAAVTALAADLTREQHRTKIMAMIGSTIGLVFAGSMVGAPVLYGVIGMSGIFILTGILALLAIVLLLKVVPPAPPIPAHDRPPFSMVLTNPDLLRLNFGVFSLHIMQMAMFVVVPHALVTFGQLPVTEHWKVYLPAVLASFVIMVPAIISAERGGKMKLVFSGAIGLLMLVQLGLWLAGQSLVGLGVWLGFFFVSFNILEATLPSLVSRTAPPAARGAALGVYNTTQALGVSVGGTVGGSLAQHFGDNSVFAALAGLAVIWLLVAISMKFPQRQRAAAAAHT